MKTLHELSAQFDGRFEFSPYKARGANGVRVTDTKKKRSRVIVAPTQDMLLSEVEHQLLCLVNNEGLK